MQCVSIRASTCLVWDGSHTTQGLRKQRNQWQTEAYNTARPEPQIKAGHLQAPAEHTRLWHPEALRACRFLSLTLVSFQFFAPQLMQLTAGVDLRSEQFSSNAFLRLLQPRSLVCPRPHFPRRSRGNRKEGPGAFLIGAKLASGIFFLRESSHGRLISVGGSSLASLAESQGMSSKDRSDTSVSCC